MNPLPRIYGPATIDPEVTFGRNCTVWQYATICAGTTMSEDCVIGSCVWIGKNCRIGKGVHFNHGCFIPHNTVIGDFVFFGPGVQLTDDRRPIAGKRTTYRAEPPVIKEWVSLGAGAIVLPGVTIGSGAMIGAGAVVTRDVQATVTAIGMPARPNTVNVKGELE